MKAEMDFIKWLAVRFPPVKKILFKKYMIETVNAIIELLFTLLLGLLIEAIFFQNSVAKFLTQTGIYLFLFLIRFFLKKQAACESICLQEQILVKLRNLLYDKTIKAKANILNSMNTGENIQVFATDVENLYACLGQSLQAIFIAIVQIFSIVLLIGFYHPLLSFMVLTLAGISTFLTGISQKKYQDARRIYRKKNGQYLDWISEHLKGMKDIRMNQAEVMMSRLFENETIHNLQEKEKIRFIEIKFERLIGLVSMMSTILFWFVSAVMIMRGELAVGIFYVINQYFAVLTANMTSIGLERATIGNCLPGCERIRENCDRSGEDERKNTDVCFWQSKTGKLCFDKVLFGYGGKPVLRDLSVVFEPGKMVAVVGGNGEGKTTLLNLIIQFYHKECGRIEYGGNHIEDLSLEKWRDNIGYVQQATVIFGGSLRDNMLLYAPKVKPEEIWESLKAACMYETVKEWKEGLDTDLLGGERLSEGQRQRIAIARALAKKPLILLMDEPTAALDYETEQKIIYNIKKMCRNQILIIITHRVEVARQAEKIVVLKDGRVHAEGNHKRLFRENTYYKNLFMADHQELNLI